MPLSSLFVSAGAKHVDDTDDLFILVAPQNAVGNCIIEVSILRLWSTIIFGEQLCLTCFTSTFFAVKSPLIKFTGSSSYD